MKNLARYMFLLRASCSSNDSQQIILASHRKAAKGGITAGHGVNSRRNCLFKARMKSPTRDISLKSLMFSRCSLGKHLSFP